MGGRGRESVRERGGEGGREREGKKDGERGGERNQILPAPVKHQQKHRHLSL